MNKVFKSAISRGLILIPVIITIGTCFLGLTQQKDVVYAILILLLVDILLFWMLFDTKYIIKNNGDLLMRSGPMWKQIRISNIDTIDDSNFAIWKFCASLDKITINYNKGNSVIVSPENKDGFINALKAINPAIEVKL